MQQLLAGTVHLVPGLVQISLGVERGRDHPLQAAGDFFQQAFAKGAGIVEQTRQLAPSLADEVIEGAGQGAVQVPRQQPDQGIAECRRRVVAHLLTQQEQRRTQAHARSGHARWQGHHADQVDAQADPVQRVGRVAFHQRDDVVQGIDQGNDVAGDRQACGRVLQPLKGDQAAADRLQPGIETPGAEADVFNGQGIERDDRDLRFARGLRGGGAGHEVSSSWSTL